MFFSLQNNYIDQILCLSGQEVLSNMPCKINLPYMDF